MRRRAHRISASDVAKAIKTTDASREAIPLDLNDPDRGRALEVWRADMAAESEIKAGWRAQFPGDKPKASAETETETQTGGFRPR